MRPTTTLALHSSLLGIALLYGCATAQKPIQAPLDTGYTLRVEQVFEALPNGTYINFQLGQRL